MSEIGNPLVPRRIIEVGKSRPGGWQSLRLVVHRGHSDWLTVGLIETTWAGRSALDARVAGVEVPWTPQSVHESELRIYALSRAMQGLTQTRHL